MKKYTVSPSSLEEVFLRSMRKGKEHEALTSLRDEEEFKHNSQDVKHRNVSAVFHFGEGEAQDLNETNLTVDEDGNAVR